MKQINYRNRLLENMTLEDYLEEENAIDHIEDQYDNPGIELMET